MDCSGENGALPPEGAGAGDASGGAGVEPPFAAAPESLRNAFGLRRCAGVERVPLYRSRELTEATADDILLMRSLGIATVFDLRKQAERDLSPEPAIVCEAFDVRICTVDLQDDENRTRATMAPNVKAAYGKPGQRMIDLYGIMATHAGEVREIVRQILSADEPCLVHCANGKDRAGIVCACVQRFYGVSRETIVEDYLATNVCNEAINRRDLRRYAGIMQPEEVEVLAAMFEARIEYLDAFFSAIDERYGSFGAWMGT